MLIRDSEAIERLGSPLNLLNRMRNTSPRSKSMNLFIPSKESKSPSGSLPTSSSFTPSFSSAIDKTRDIPINPEVLPAELILSRHEIKNEIKTDDLIDSADNKIKLAHAHDQALSTLNKAMEALHRNIDDIRPDRLPSVISSTNKVVESIRRERIETAKSKSGKDVHLHFYTPVQKQASDYEIIEVG